MDLGGPTLPQLSHERLALREIVAIRRALAALEAQLVRTARIDGASWTDLGGDLGLTRQGARRRHLVIDPVAAPPRRLPFAGFDAYLERYRLTR